MQIQTNGRINSLSNPFAVGFNFADKVSPVNVPAYPRKLRKTQIRAFGVSLEPRPWAMRNTSDATVARINGFKQFTGNVNNEIEAKASKKDQLHFKVVLNIVKKCYCYKSDCWK